MFTIASFPTAQGWEGLKCPLMGEWTSKMQSVSTAEYFPAFKRKDIAAGAMTFTDPDTTPSGRCQTRGQTLRDSSVFTGGTRSSQTRQKVEWWRGVGVGAGGWCLAGTEFPLYTMKSLRSWLGRGEGAECHWTGHVTTVQSRLSILCIYRNKKRHKKII